MLTLLLWLLEAQEAQLWRNTHAFSTEALQYQNVWVPFLQNFAPFTEKKAVTPAMMTFLLLVVPQCEINLGKKGVNYSSFGCSSWGGKVCLSADHSFCLLLSSTSASIILVVTAMCLSFIVFHGTGSPFSTQNATAVVTHWLFCFEHLDRKNLIPGAYSITHKS
jgi:hypothetical protein